MNPGTPVTPIPYVPHTTIRPGRVLDHPLCPSSWVGIESILADLLSRFNVGRKFALEFGCEYGYSAIAFSNFFERVLTVDPFGQLTHQLHEMSRVAERNCAPYGNIEIVRMTWQRFTEAANGASAAQFDLVHIDAEHNYEECYGNGAWACERSPVVVFHDTTSFPEVMRAVGDLAERYQRVFYNFEPCHGFGILVRP